MKEDTSKTRIYEIEVTETRIQRLVVCVSAGKKFEEVSDKLDAEGCYDDGDIIKRKVRKTDITKFGAYKLGRAWWTPRGDIVSYEPEDLVEYENPTQEI